MSLLQTITSFLTNKLLLHQNLKIFLANKDLSISINSKKIYHLALACGDVFATIDINLFNPGDEVQSNRLALAGDAAPIDPKIMDTDIKRFVEVHQKSLTKMYIK